MKQGLFVTFEGGEGSGKSTQIPLLSDWLKLKGYNVISTSEPPKGSHLFDAIHHALKFGKEDMCTGSEMFLLQAGRAQHVHEVIQPALNKGYIVLCDRFYDSTIVYQGYGRGFSLSEIRAANMIASGGLIPDLTYLLDVKPEVGLAQRKRQIKDLPTTHQLHQDKYENKELDFHKKLFRGYHALAREEAFRFRVIPRDTIEQMQERIREEINPFLKYVK